MACFRTDAIIVPITHFKRILTIILISVKDDISTPLSSIISSAVEVYNGRVVLARYSVALAGELVNVRSAIVITEYIQRAEYIF
jgi:hypothetical protein